MHPARPGSSHVTLCVTYFDPDVYRATCFTRYALGKGDCVQSLGKTSTFNYEIHDTFSSLILKESPDTGSIRSFKADHTLYAMAYKPELYAVAYKAPQHFRRPAGVGLRVASGNGAYPSLHAPPMSPVLRTGSFHSNTPIARRIAVLRAERTPHACHPIRLRGIICCFCHLFAAVCPLREEFHCFFASVCPLGDQSLV